MNEFFRLDGQVAVVTGDKGLLGPIWSKALLEQGARVAGIDLPLKSPSKGFWSLLNYYHDQKLKTYEANITNKGALIEVKDRIIEALGVPSILVNNAGIDHPPIPNSDRYSTFEFPFETIMETLSVNLAGTMLVSQVFGEQMVALRRGSIINIGSLYGTVATDRHFYDHIPTKSGRPFEKPLDYGPSKAGLLQFTKELAARLGPFNVRVNALSPGGIFNKQDEEFVRKFSRRVPLGRMGFEDDLYGPLIFLASDASKYITGYNLQVDGGFTTL